MKDNNDAHNLKILSTREVLEAFLGFFVGERREHIEMVMDEVSDPNEKVAYLRSCVIGRLVECCADAFLECEEQILEGTMQGSLLKHIPELEQQGYARCNEISWDKIYRSGDVVDIELAGNRIITFLLDKMLHAVLNPELNYSSLLLAKFPEQYNTEAPTLYGKIQAVLDHLSAMTDVYALDLYRKLNGIQLRIEN